MANTSQQQLLSTLQQRLATLGITDPLTISPNNTIVFASGPNAGKEVDTLNLLGVGSGGKNPEADVYTGSGQNQMMTALSGPNKGQTRAAPNGMSAKDWALTAGFLAAPFAAPALAGGALGPSAFGGGSAAAGAGGTVTADLPVTGVPEAIDPATGLVTSQLPNLAAGGSSLLPTIAKLGTAGVGLGLNLASRNSSTQANAPLMAALNTLLPQMQQRFQQTQPLFNSTVNMAHGMLPKAYQ